MNPIPTQTVLIAIGNTLRGDDGVAHIAIDSVTAFPDAYVIHANQLTIEMAADIASARLVIFADADPAVEEPMLSSICAKSSARPPTIGHAIVPEAVVALAVALYGFVGMAYLCHIPARDFDCGPSVSERSRRMAIVAAALIDGIPQPESDVNII